MFNLVLKGLTRHTINSPKSFSPRVHEIRKRYSPRPELHISLFKSITTLWRRSSKTDKSDVLTQEWMNFRDAGCSTNAVVCNTVFYFSSSVISLFIYIDMNIHLFINSLYIYIYIYVHYHIAFIPQASVALGVLAVLLED